LPDIPAGAVFVTSEPTKMKIPSIFTCCFGDRTQNQAHNQSIGLQVQNPPQQNAHQANLQQTETQRKKFYANTLQTYFRRQKQSGSEEGTSSSGINQATDAFSTVSYAGTSTIKQTSSLDNITDQASAKIAIEEFKKTLLQQGSSYRINDQEREEFIAAYKKLFGSSGEQDYKMECQAIDDIRDLDVINYQAHPELSHIPTAELVAIRGWTGNGIWPLVQDALEGGLFNPDTNWNDPDLKVAAGARNLQDWEKVKLVLPYIKAFISGYNSLPPQYDYKGKVYTGETHDENWVKARYEQGKDMTDWRFFATAKTAQGAWQNQTINWQTSVVRGKLIQIFSLHPQEGEVMIAPPAFHAVPNLTRKENATSPNFPYFDIELNQKEKP
jgi:hypothetical protein